MTGNPSTTGHKPKRFDELWIADKIRKGLPFRVGSNAERKDALKAAKFLGGNITTRKNPNGGFDIYFLNPVMVIK